MARIGQWVPVGPAPEGSSGFGVAGGVSGRVWSIAISSNFDQQGTLAMYLGVSGGGVWRSTDFTGAAPAWTPLLDHFPDSFPLSRVSGLPNIGALAVDPNHPWVIYAGSGDPDDHGPNTYGQGMIKSEDGGQTWQLLDVLPNPFTPGFCQITVDPSDPSGNTVYAAGAFGPGSPLRGIFKTGDGGARWVSAQAGMPENVAVHDIASYCLNGALTLFAGVTDVSGSNPGANGIWVSQDGAKSWQQMPLGPMTDLTSGGAVAPQSSIGLIKLAAGTVAGAGEAFAAISNGNQLMNVFKLASGQWQPAGANGLRTINTTSAQAIGLSPAGEVYVGGVNNARQNGLYRSPDLGATWQSIDVGSNGRRPHTDQHAWAFHDGKVFNGNDGGIYVYDPGAGTWNDLNTASLQTILTQGVGVHPQGPDAILEGSQDNGVALRTAGQWRYVGGGDAAACQFDPFDPSYAYLVGPSDYSFFFRSSNGGQSFPDDRSVTGKPHVQSYPPFCFHLTQPGRLAITLDRVYETRNRGDDGWTAISGYLAGPSQFGSAVAYGGGDVIYAAMGGRLFQTGNDGTAWTELTPGGGGWGGGITTIAVDPRNLSRVYAGTDGGRIWRSADAGASWADITGAFPAATLAVNKLAMHSDDGQNEPMLFAASNVGVWQRSGDAWSRFADLPDVNVTDLQFCDATLDLVAGCYGRGVWTAQAVVDHFYTVSAAERDNAVQNYGYRIEGVAAYVLATQLNGAVPLHRLVKDTHFYTISDAERDNAISNLGYVSEGEACFVYAAPTGTVPFYRLVNVGHFYTTSLQERDNAVAAYGYHPEDIACHVFAAPRGDTVEFYRLVKGNDHFYTTSAAERDNAVSAYGYQDEGTACNVFASPQPGTVPLHRLVKDTHFYTISDAERDNAINNLGYTSEGEACYVFAAPTGTVPLYRLVKTDHFYTTALSERDNAITVFGYHSENIACHVYESPVGNTVPFFRLVTG